MKQYGLLGRKLSHSLSADYFNSKFKNENIDAQYRLYELESADSFPQFMDSHPDIAGLNVTIPYKQEVIRYLDELSEEAAEIGAVNVIKRLDNSKLKGYNTDAAGFRRSLKELIENSYQHPFPERALVLGSGGASAAVCHALKSMGIIPTVVSRTRDDNKLTYADLDFDLIEQNQVIVNTTPLGMYPDIITAPPFPYALLLDNHICFDCVYNPADTTFMKLARRENALTENGLKMLYYQADEAWKIWNE